MAITDIDISEELETGAPSIKYSGDEGPKSPEQEQQMMADALLKEEYDKYIYDLLEQRPDATPMSFQEFRQMVLAEGQMSGGQPLLEDPTKPVNPFAPKPTGPVLPNKMAFDDTPSFELEELKLLIEEFEADNGRSPSSIDDLRRYFYIKYGSDRISEMEEMVSERQTAAYGGIMGLDGRRRYGLEVN